MNNSKIDDIATKFKVSVILQRELKNLNSWSVQQWDLATILSDFNGPDSLEGPIQIQESKSKSLFLWKGLNIRLFLDAAEGYWYNLLSDVPYGFLVCDPDTTDDTEPPVPMLITISQDEAGAHMETDNLVLSAPLPSDIVANAEKFVVSHYVPQEKKKRKRRNWTEETIRNKIRDS